MVKYFTAFLLVMISSAYLFAQNTAMVSLPFHMYDNAGGQKTLYFGVDSTATDSIDADLGESDLPPFPPPGIFETRWVLPAGGFSGALSSYKDYRYEPGLPFADTIEYRLKYQGADSADTMFFQWNLPPEITAFMQDVITGTLINVFMSDSGVYGLTNFGAFNQMKLFVYFNFVPVELTSFTASVNGQAVYLSWNTATELNNKGFAVEQLSESQGDNWEEIGFVPGSGTTTEPGSYSFIDNNLTNGTYSYRLKQIDFDGSYEYSQAVEVNVYQPQKFSLSQNYPNPFNPTTSISYSVSEDGFVRLSVYNVLGQRLVDLVNGEVKSGIHQVSFDAKNLSSGVYYYRLETKSFTSTKKMMLLR